MAAPIIYFTDPLPGTRILLNGYSLGTRFLLFATSDSGYPKSTH
jgi:hypothetical protein